MAVWGPRDMKEGGFYWGIAPAIFAALVIPTP